MAKKSSKSRRNKKLLNQAGTLGQAMALYNLIGVAFFCLLLVGFGLLFIFVGGKTKPMSPEQLERENERRRRLNKAPVNQGSPKTAIGIGIGLMVLAVAIFAFSVYSYKFLRSNKKIAAVYGAQQGYGMVRRNAPAHLRWMF